MSHPEHGNDEDEYAASLSPTARALLEGIEAQCDGSGDIDTTTETAIAIAPPIDLEELASHIDKVRNDRLTEGLVAATIPMDGIPGEATAQALSLNEMLGQKELEIVAVSETTDECTHPHVLVEFSDGAVVCMRREYLELIAQGVVRGHWRAGEEDPTDG